MPAYFTMEHLVGAVPPADFNGLQALGSYGAGWLSNPTTCQPVTLSGRVEASVESPVWGKHLSGP